MSVHSWDRWEIASQCRYSTMWSCCDPWPWPLTFWPQNLTTSYCNCMQPVPNCTEVVNLMKSSPAVFKTSCSQAFSIWTRRRNALMDSARTEWNWISFRRTFFSFFSNLVIIFVLAVEDFRFAPSVTAGVRVCVITSHKFVNTVPYKPLVGILPKLQLRCSWGERWTD